MRIRIAAALAVATGVTALGAPAHADTVVVRDPARDVVSLAAADDESLAQPAPARREGDVRALRVRHGAQRITATMSYERLTRPRGGQQAVHVVSLRTGKGRLGEVALLTSRRQPQGELFWTYRNRSPRCAGLRTHVSYAADTVRVSVPRRCVGKPRVVRAGGGTGVMVGDTLFVDDAQRDGSIGEDIALGSPIRR